MIPFVSILLLIAAVSWMLTALVRHYALKTSMVDIPNERSSHSVPTPRGGGVASVVVFYAALFCFFLPANIEKTLLYALLSGVSIALIGFIDDRGHVSSKIRFTVHIISAVAALVLMGDIPSLNLGFVSLHFYWLLFPLFAVLLAWMLNLFNFMDGIDGLAGSQGVFVCVGSSLLMVMKDASWQEITNGSFGFGFHHDYGAFLILAMSLLGFLVWNWPKAKIFMGDACSGFVGFSLGVMMLYAAKNHSLELISSFILWGVFFVDATWTLLNRMLSGQKWSSAHRSHLYQILSRRWSSHLKVTVLMIAVNVLWLLPLAWLANIYPVWSMALLVLAYVPIVFFCFRLRAGHVND